MDLWRAFELLEIDETPSPTEIKQRYRDLAAIWHPDRHSDNPRRQQIAQEKMKEVNAAYDYICAYLLQKKNAGIVGGMKGFLIIEVNWMKRFLLMACGVMIMIPGWRTRVSGTMIILVIGLWILLTKKGKEDYYEV